MARPVLILIGLAVLMTLVTTPLAMHLQPDVGVKLSLLAGLTCLVAGLSVVCLPVLFPVSETYVMVVALGFGVRMVLPLIACGLLVGLVGLSESRTFAICLLIISPVLLFWETWCWVRCLSGTPKLLENK